MSDQERKCDECIWQDHHDKNCCRHPDNHREGLIEQIADTGKLRAHPGSYAKTCKQLNKGKCKKWTNKFATLI
jgi:hypothetical protein